jgi:hypothetical protein
MQARGHEDEAHAVYCGDTDENDVSRVSRAFYDEPDALRVFADAYDVGEFVCVPHASVDGVSCV